MLMFIIKPYIIEPLGIAYLSSYLNKIGYDHVLCTVDNTLLDKIKYYKPKYLAYSVTTGQHVYYKNINDYLRSKIDWECYSVFGGPHVTFINDFIDEDNVDYCCVGEGFEALPDLVSGISNPKNIISKDNKNLILRDRIDKKKLLHPNRSIVYQFPRNYNNHIRSVMCSFFCYFNCTYCYNKNLKDLYNVRNPELVPVDSIIDQIHNLLEYPTKLIFFQDDIFPVFDNEWLSEFIAKYKFKIPFHIQLRAEFINDDQIRQLKLIGLHGVTFAIESGNYNIRRTLLKRNITDDTIIRASEIVHKYGIKLRTECMIGIPHETKKDVISTVKLTSKCKPDIGWASLYQPYPGTQLGVYCEKNNMVDGSFNDLSESFFDTYRIKTKYKKYFITLQRFFMFVVKHKYFRFIVPILSLLPLDKYYKKFYNIYKKILYDKLYMVG